MAEDKPKPATYCPVCGAKRWTTEQIFKHIKKKHPEILKKK